LDKIIDVNKIKSPYMRSLFVHHTAKFYRLRDEQRTTRRNKWQKKLFHKWQVKHQGRLPDLSVIPDNTDCCYTYTDEIDQVIEWEGQQHTIFKHKMCPYYYTLEIPEVEREQHIGIVAMGQTCIGGCHLLGKTDDDMRGSGLLWDELKECYFKMHKYIPGENDD
jgi:hypothetical protein